MTAKGRMAAALMLGAVVLVSGCREEDPPAISVDQQMFRVGTEAQELSVRLMSNTDWTATYSNGAKYDPTSGDGWLTLSSERGHGSANLTIFVEPYKGALADGRQGVITFTTTGSNADIATVIINQSEQNNLLQVIPPEYIIGGEGGSVYFTVVSNTNWEIFGEADWAVLSQTTGTGNATVKVDVADYGVYNESATREIAYQVVAGHSSDTVVEEFLLIQKGKPDPTITLGQESVHFPATVDAAPAITATIPVITNVELPAGSSPVVTVAESWVAATVAQVNGIWTITIDPKDNSSFDERSTIVTVIIPSTDAVGGSVMKQIRVTQDGAESPSLEMLGIVYNIPSSSSATGGLVTKTIGYIASTGLNVTVKEYPDWFNAAPTVSSGTITFVAKPNYNENQRVGTIVVVGTAGGRSIARSVTIIQDGMGEFDLTATPTTVNLLATAPAAPNNTFKVYVHSSMSMTIKAVIQVDGSWITLPTTFTPVANTGNATGTTYVLSFSYPSNDAADQRMGTVEIFAEAGNQSKVVSVNVTQAGVGGPNIMIAPPRAVVPNKAAPDNVTVLQVLDGMGVTVSQVVSPSGWVTAAFDAATNPTTVTLTTSSVNGAIGDREASLFIVATKGGKTQHIEVPIIQPGTAAAELDIASLVYEVEAAGKAFSIPVMGLNGSTWEILGTDAPTGMFSTAPAEGVNVLTGTVAANEASTDRTALITLLATNGDNTKMYTIAIKQLGLRTLVATLAAPDGITIPWDTDGEAEQTIIVNDLFAGAAPANISMTSSATWLTGGTITVNGTVGTLPIWTTGVPSGINPTVKDRVADVYVTITRGTETQTLATKVTQSGAPAPTALLTTYEIRIPATLPAGYTRALTFYNYNTNTTFGSTIDISDPTVVSAATVAAGVLTITPTGSNTGTDERSSTVTVYVTAAGVTTPVVVTVIQNGTGQPDVNVLPSSFLLGPAGASVSVMVDNPNGATVSLVPTTLPAAPVWVAPASPLSGSATSITFTLAVADNETAYDRSVTLMYQAVLGGKTVTYPVSFVQSGLNSLSATLSRYYADFGPAATTAATTKTVEVLDLPAGATVTAVSASDGWITPTWAGSGATNFTIGVAVNDGAERFGSVAVTVKRGSGVTAESETLLVEVMQAAVGAPEARVNPNSLIFNADQTAAQTIAVNIMDSKDTYVHTVTGPSWLTLPATIAAPAAGATTTTFNVTPAGTNDTSAPLTGDIMLYVKNGDKTQTITIPVTQKGLLVPIYPLTSTTVFPAVASGNAIQQTIELLGFNTTDYQFTFGQTNGAWFTVVAPAAGETALKVYPKTKNDAKTPRTGTIAVTVRAKNDPSYVSKFDITVTQEGVLAPNITYQPADHYFRIEGGTAYVEFSNPDNLSLNIVSPSGDSFIDELSWDNPLKLKVVVLANAATSIRETKFSITATNSEGILVGEYPVTLHQDGVGASVPLLHVSFTPPFARATASDVITATTILPATVAITGAAAAPGAPDWLSGVTFTGSSVTVTIDDTAADWPAAGNATLWPITVTITETTPTGSASSTTTYYALAENNLLPLIGATIAPAALTILDTHTSLATVGNPAVNLNGATVGTITKACIGGGTWLDGATISAAGGELTVTGIAPNLTTADRSAVITIPLTLANHMNESLNFVLTQKGIPTIDAVWQSSYLAASADMTLTAVPSGNPNTGAVDAASIVAPAWVTGTSVVGANSDQIKLDFPANSTNAPLIGNVTFTMTKAGYADQNCSFTLIQLPATTSALLTVNPASNIPWGVGTTGAFTYTKADPATVVTIWTPRDPMFSNVVDAAGTVTATAAANNISGSDQIGHVLLKAVNGPVTEWYQIPVTQLTMTPQQLRDLTTPAAGNGVSSLTYNRTAGTINADFAALLTIIANSGQIDFSVAGFNTAITGNVTGIPTNYNNYLTAGFNNAVNPRRFQFSNSNGFMGGGHDFVITLDITLGGVVAPWTINLES